MNKQDFFEESREQSLVKATIVCKYFDAWAKVIIPVAKRHGSNIGYIDLFAGRGYYKDGTKSTPLMILEKAIQNLDLRERLITVFNDKDPENIESLKTAIKRLPGISSLKHEPNTPNEVVGETLVKEFETMHFIPTLFFVDPYGYKGLSLALFNSILKDWGCDCIFFFNYNRINPGLSNPSVGDHIDALFGKERAQKLREKLNSLNPYERELTIVEEIAQALKEGGKHVLPFCFKNDKGNRTSHHLIFVSKDPTGYKIMKEIMANESSSSNLGVPSFMYSPATSRQTLLFELTRPLEELEEMLLREYASRSIRMRQIYDDHNIDRPYILKNYKYVLRKLEAQGKITADPPADRRPKRKEEVTFADHVIVTFPPRKS
jgi:three-Cys-motif partner protein